MHKFGNLARYSAFRNNLNGNLFVYDLLRKLNKAVPNALVIASTRYQFSLPRTESFQAYLDAAVTIAHKLQVDPSILCQVEVDTMQTIVSIWDIELLVYVVPEGALLVPPSKAPAAAEGKTPATRSKKAE